MIGNRIGAKLFYLTIILIKCNWILNFRGQKLFYFFFSLSARLTNKGGVIWMTSFCIGTIFKKSKEIKSSFLLSNLSFNFNILVFFFIKKKCIPTLHKHSTTNLSYNLQIPLFFWKNFRGCNCSHSIVCDSTIYWYHLFMNSIIYFFIVEARH